MKIAVLGAKTLPYPGGIEIVVEQIGKRLVRRGHHVTVFERPKYSDHKRTSLIYEGIELFPTTGLATKHAEALTHSITAIPLIIKKRFDIVYINCIGLSTLALIPRFFGIKTIVQTHGLDWKREKWGKLAKIFIKGSTFTTAFFPNLTFCVCKEDSLYFTKKFRRNFEVLPNGVEIEKPIPPNNIQKKYGLKNKDYVLFMSRLVPEKGCHFLIEAWKKLPIDIRGDKKLVIAGDSAHKDSYYYKLIENQDNDILFTGFVTGIVKHELLSNALLFIQPSTIEGMPLSILEAFSYGNFVIASDIQENIDTLGPCGLKFEKANSEDLREKLVYVLRNQNLIDLEREKAITWVKDNHNWDTITDKFEKGLNYLVN